MEAMTLVDTLLLLSLLTGIGLGAEHLLKPFGPNCRTFVCRTTLVCIFLFFPLSLLGMRILPLFPSSTSETERLAPPALSTSLSLVSPAQPTDKEPVSVETYPTQSKSPRASASALRARPVFTGFLPDATLAKIAPVAGNTIVDAVLVVAVLRLFWLSLAYTGTLRLRRAATSAPDVAPDVRISDRIESALLVGILHPVILVPSRFFIDLPPDLQAAILAHERTHRARRDPLWNLGFRVAEALLWPLLFLPILRSRHADASEEIADQAALDSGTSAQVYASCLLRLAERQSSRWLATGIGLDKPQIARRVETLLKGTTWKIAPPRLSVFVVLTAALFVLSSTLVAARTFAQQPTNEWGRDGRLNKTVSVNAEGIALAELLPIISQKVGVTLRAESGVADEKVIVFSNKRSLRDTLTDIAVLFGYHWRETKDDQGKITYRLETTGKTRSYEARLATEDRDWILSRLNALVAALAETPEQIKKRKSDDPVRQTLEHSRLAVELYTRLTRDQRTLMVDNYHVNLPIAGLPPAQKKALAPLFYEGPQFKEEPQFIERGDGTTTLDGVTPIHPTEMEKTSLSFEMMLINGGGDGKSLQITMRAPTGFDLPLAAIPAPDTFALPIHGNPYEGSAVSEELPDATITSAKWVDNLKELARKSGRPVVADFYRSDPIHVGDAQEVEKPESRMGKLDALCVKGGNLWWTGGKTLFFRKRDWYRQKTYEVTDKWRVATTAQWTARDGKFVVADLQPLTTLTARQLVGLQGGVTDLRLVDGLLPVLRLVTLTASPGQSILPTKSEHYQTFLIPLNSPQLAEPLAGLSEHYTRPVWSGTNPDQFGIALSGELAAQSNTVDCSWCLRPAKDSLVAGGMFHLPLVIPEDRRDKTAVSIP